MWELYKNLVLTGEVNYYITLSDVPKELFNLSKEQIQAYYDALAGGEEMVYKCRVMLVGYARAGKSNILNTLLDRAFEREHRPTNSMSIDKTKTRNWHPQEETGMHLFQNKTLMFTVNDT